MQLPTNMEPLLHKEMSRKEFLITLGLGVASIFGFSTILHLLTGKSVGSHVEHRVTEGYSSDVYGGGKE